MWMLWLMLLLFSLAGSTNQLECKAQFWLPGKMWTCSYPFGTDDHNCSMNSNFFLNYSRSDSATKLMIGKLEVFYLSIKNGTIIASFFAAHHCYDGLGNQSSGFNDPSVSLGSNLLRFSDTRNKLMAFGCHTLAYMGKPGSSGVAVFPYAQMNLPS